MKHEFKPHGIMQTIIKLMPLSVLVSISIALPALTALGRTAYLVLAPVAVAVAVAVLVAYAIAMDRKDREGGDR